jgi:hemerythrin-like domain-containing protein
VSHTESFIQLIKVHEWLDGLFLAHQTALLSLDIREAEGCLGIYEANLLLHIKDEEELLIPTYGAHVSDIPGGAVELFTGEHKKLLGFIGEFHEALTQLRCETNLELKHGIILLLDREAMYKGLLGHHHEREHNVLFPWLDRLTSETERKKLLEQCASLKAYRSR